MNRRATHPPDNQITRSLPYPAFDHHDANPSSSLSGSEYFMQSIAFCYMILARQ